MKLPGNDKLVLTRYYTYYPTLEEHLQGPWGVPTEPNLWNDTLVLGRYLSRNAKSRFTKRRTSLLLHEVILKMLYAFITVSEDSSTVYRELSRTSSRVCINVSNSPNPSRVYIRLCKHGKRFLLLKYPTEDQPLPTSTQCVPIFLLGRHLQPM